MSDPNKTMPRWAVRHPEAWAAARAYARTPDGCWPETMQAWWEWYGAARPDCPQDPVASVRRWLGEKALHPSRREVK